MTNQPNPIARLQAEAEEKRTALEASITEAENYQRRLSALQRNVDDAADALIRADSQLAALKGAAASMEDAMLRAWGNATHAVDGTATAPPDYSALVAIRAAIEDFPRCRKQLTQNLAVAQRALDDFQTR